MSALDHPVGGFLMSLVRRSTMNVPVVLRSPGEVVADVPPREVGMSAMSAPSISSRLGGRYRSVASSFPWSTSESRAVLAAPVKPPR
jgi:hypothetical protein